MMDMNPTQTVVSEENCNKSNKTGTTCGTGTAYPSGASQIFSGVRVARSLVFCVMFCKSLFVITSLISSNFSCNRLKINIIVGRQL